MKTNNDYQMFFQGYLEALTDIDGDQREFGSYVRMFDSSNKEHLLDIQKAFNYKDRIKTVYTKQIRSFSIEFFLRRFLFINLFNGARIPKESIDSFRDYVIFHLSDYINFSFYNKKDEFSTNKKLYLFTTRTEHVNKIYFVMYDGNKKLVMCFYRNRKYMSDKDFDKWVKKMIQEEEKSQKKYIRKHFKKWGIKEHKINSFRYKEYDKDEILESAYEILVCSDIKSKSMKKICAQNEWKLKKLIPLYAKGLDEVYGTELKPIEEIAKWRVISSLLKVGYKEEYKFKKRLKHILNAVKEYNQKFQTKKSMKVYKSNNKYGYCISPELHEFLVYFENVIHENKKDKVIATVLKKKYQKESMQELWKEIFSQLKQIIIAKQ